MEVVRNPQSNNATNLPTKNVCLVCGKGFSQKSSLKSHFKLHTKSDLLQCDYCLKYYSRKSTLEQHVRKHTKLNVFQCELCDKYYTVHTKLLNHLRSHDNSKTFKCDRCDRSYRYKHSLISHLASHNGIVNTCEVCGKCYGKKTNLDRHFLMHEESKSFECNVCLKRFYQKVHLEKHLVVHSGEKKFLCQICGKAFNRKDSLAKHAKLHTSKYKDNNIDINEVLQNEMLYDKYDIERDDTDDNILTDNYRDSIGYMTSSKIDADLQNGSEKCFIDDDDKAFNRKDSLAKHAKLHTSKYKDNNIDINEVLQNEMLDDKYDIERDDTDDNILTDNYRDSIGYMTSSKIDANLQNGSENFFIDDDDKGLNITNNIHSDNIKSFNNTNMNVGSLHINGQLNMTSKLGDTDIKCKLCNKSYKHEKSLKTHMRLHTLENAIVCEICMKVFAVSSKYETHKLSHMGVKIFGCKLCEKRFTARQSLTAHYRGHIGDKPVQCAECGKRFTKQSSLSRHTLLHSRRGAAPARASRRAELLCAQCGRPFSRQDVLRVHMKTCLNK